MTTMDDETLRRLLDARRHGRPMDDRKRAELYDLAWSDGGDPETLYQAWRWGDADEVDAELAALAPALAAEVLRLRAIIEGRPTPPTTAEVEAHMAAGGAWLASIGARVQILAGRIKPSSHTDFTRWVALDRECRPCAWPTPTPDAPRYVTTSQPGAAIEVQEHRLSPEERATLDFGRKPFGGGR